MKTSLTGYDLKRDGMDRVEVGANPEWKSLMLSLVERVAKEKSIFYSDDVFAMYNEIENPPSTPDKRAFGPVMRRAVKLGYCEKAGLAAVQSLRPNIHRSLMEPWRSLIFEKKNENRDPS